MKDLLKVNRSFLLFLLLATCLVVPSFADVESFTGHQLSDDGGVVASYDKDSMTIIVTGTGQINRDKWIDLAKRVTDIEKQGNVFYCPSGFPPVTGWSQNNNNGEKTVSNITFHGDKDKSISLPSDSTGFFSELSADIVFEKKVDVSRVENMTEMFRMNDVFNSDISDWDTSSVTNMIGMFAGARLFNGDISGWTTSNVTNMSFMFTATDEFNGDISSWDVSQVNEMVSMFGQAKSFNQDLPWDTSNLTSMHEIFYEAEAFNGDISSWDTSNVVSFEAAFSGCKNIDKINLLNRKDIGLEYIELRGLFDETNASFLAFDNLPIFYWSNMPYLYWISEKNGQFKKAKDPYMVFNGGLKYVLETKITSYPKVSDYEGVYTGNKVSMDDIAHSCKDFVGYDIAGAWDLDLHGHNGTDVGNYTATVTFTPDDTEKYRTPESIDININITKAIPNVTVPTELRGWKNQSLSEVRIPVVDGGVWQFKNASTPLSREGLYEYDIVYTPASSNYMTVETKAEVEVLQYIEEASPMLEDTVNKVSKVVESNIEKEVLVNKSIEKENVLADKGLEKDTLVAHNNVVRSNQTADDNVDSIIKDEVYVPESESDALPYGDVKSSDWYFESVKKMYRNQILKGIDDQTFAPHKKVTRGMMIAALFNMSGEEDVAVTSDFTDVKNGSYYEKAISWGKKMNVVKGDGKLFRPDAHIQRQDIIAMLYRYKNCDCDKEIEANSKKILAFSDASQVLDYARDAMDWALSTGIMKGREESVLAPREVLTRAELATILERFSRLAK